MIVETINFGKIEVPESKIIYLTEPILGFEEYQRYTIIRGLEDEPFYWLQSLDEGELAFIMINPFQFFQDYSFNLPERVKEKLAVKEDSDLLINTIVVIDQETGDIRTNLKAPVIINGDNNKGAQVILEEDYPTRFYLVKGETAVEERVSE
ncbi:MAG: flagellar assembly protein FliW [Halanaerobiales bacterium]|jgi:flagellar assembly factor FliW